MPLFPFVWQYSNQPIEQLAADVAEIVINDANYIPISSGTTFENSPIFSNGSVMRSVFGGTLEGFVIDAFNNVYKYGALEGATNATNLEITDNIGDAKLTALWQGVNETTFGIRGDIRTLYTNGTSVNMGTATLSPLALKIRVDGVNYRLPLYQQ
jgi:hypothetical protein